MKKALLLLAVASTSFSAKPEEEKPYDADLFKKETPAFSIHASFLYWRAQEGALDYALKMTKEAPAGTSYAQGKYKTATFDGDPGFRIAMSYFRAPRYWDIWGQYTRMTSRGTNEVTAPSANGKYLVGTFPELISTPLSKATSSIHLNYNVADFLVDRHFVPNPHLRIRLIGGATAAWMNQNWAVRYFNDLEETTQIRNKWRFVGGGLRIGSMADWFWTDDIYLTSSFSVASLLGSYKNWASQSASNTELDPRNTRFDDVRTAFSLQFIFGPSWQKNFACCRTEIFAGYELNSWYNVQEIFRSSEGASSQAKQTWQNTGALALQGLTTRVTIDF